jgi:hypothetical protein
VGRLRGRLDKLEKRCGVCYQTLHLPGGETVRYTPEDSLEAFCASVDDAEHWLLPYFRRADTNEGMAGVIQALEG